MKKVLFIIPSLTIGGMENVQVAIANKLAETGKAVTILLLEKTDTLKEYLDPRVKLVYKSPKPHFGKSIPYIRHQLYDDGMWETRATARQLYNYYVGNERFDVEVAFFRGLPLKIISGSTNKNAKRIVWVHSDLRKAKGYQNNFRRFEDVRRAYAAMDTVVCVSKQTEEGFREVMGDTGNTKVLYNIMPVEVICRRAQEPCDTPFARAKFHLIMVGRFLNRVKGQRRLMRAVARLRENGADISLLLMGVGEEEENLRSLIREHRAEDYMTIISNNYNPYPYIKAADLLVCSSYYEGYNLTVAEAIVLGVPVLSTDCAGPNEILDYGKYGMIVENSEPGLYHGIKELYQNPLKLKAYQVKARQRAAIFDEAKMLRKLNETV